MSPELERLCVAYGVELFYHDVNGTRHLTSDAIAEEILDAMGVRTPGVVYESGGPGVVPMDPVLVLEESSAPLRIPIRSAEEPKPFRCEVILEGGPRISYQVQAFRERPSDGSGRQGRSFDFELPDVVPFGYHTLRFTENGKVWEQGLIITPSQCYVPPFIESGRAVGVSLQQYALADSQDHGIGDFGSVERLARGLGVRGVSVLGLSPVHALFPEVPNHRSPYSPSSRMFLNPAYIDLNQVPECVSDPGIASEVASLSRGYAADRTHSAIDYNNVIPAKLRLLRAMFQSFYQGEWRQETHRALEFQQFLESDPSVGRHALYEALYAHFVKEGFYGFRQWPQAYRHPDNPAVQVFAAENEQEILFRAYIQWTARLQLLDL
ncbi:MAG: 4-alpha-glucanotransferase, partial [Spirochaetia bacterium]|nr:4-alpha-glucanotransferase [Spirochaetia bacterium]